MSSQLDVGTDVATYRYNDYESGSYAWTMGKAQSFTAEMGEDLDARAAGPTLGFSGNGGSSPLPFVAVAVRHRCRSSPTAASSPC